MPVINNLKVYNFKYGTDVSRLMSHETLRLGGNHLQVEAQNTVGKSMSIQTIIQAICPFSNVAKTFVEVYTKKDPICVLIEWILDDSKTKILTGVVFEKKQYTSDEDKKGGLQRMYRLTQFVIESGATTGIDIDSFPYLFTNENGNTVVRTVAQMEEVLKSLQSKLGKDKVSFYGGNSNGRRNYKKKLTEYGISQDEWREVIIKMNDNNKEGGLSEFLNTYKTSESLMGNKIIPLIDTSLTTETDEGIKPTIKVLQQQVHHFLETSIKMRDKLADHKNFMTLKDLIAETQGNLDEVIDINNKIEETENYLAAIYVYLKNEEKRLIDEQRSFEKEAETKKEEAHQINYEKDSYDYYQEMNERDSLVSEKDEEELKLDNLEKDLASTKEKINILTYRNKHVAVTREEADKARKEAEREKESKEYQEIEKELNAYGGTIHQVLLNTVLELKSACEEAKTLINHKKEELQLQKQLINEMIGEESTIKGKKIALNTQIEDYERKTLQFVNEEPSAKKFTSYGFFGSTIDYEGFKQLVHQQIKEAQNEESLSKKTIQENEVKIKQNSLDARALMESKPALSLNASQLKERRQRMNEIYEEFSKVKKIYDFNLEIENAEMVLKALENEINKLESRHLSLFNQKAGLQEEVEKLQNVKPTHVDNELIEELSKMGIHVVEGAEYLARLDVSDEFRQKLISENKLLPFSLIVEEREYEKIIKKGIEAKLTSIAPIFKKNDLSLNSVKIANGISNFNGVTMFHSFDTNILNPELRMAKIENIKERISHIENQQEALKVEKRQLSRFREKYESFNYTLSDSQLSEKIAKIEEEIAKNEATLSRYQKENQSLEDENHNLRLNGNKATASINSFNQLLKTINELELLDRKAEEHREELSSLDKEERRIAKEKYCIEQTVKQLEQDIDEQKMSLNSKENELSNTEKELTKFKSFEAKIQVQDKTIEELKAAFEVYSGNSSSGRILELDGDIQRIQARLDEYRKEKELIFSQLSKTHEEILEAVIAESENELRAKERETADEVRYSREKVNLLRTKIHGKEQVAEKIKADIIKKYKKADVFSLKQIVNFSFDDRLKENAEEINAIREVIKDIESKRMSLSEELASLSIYKKDDVKAVETINNPKEESMKSQRLLRNLSVEKDDILKKYGDSIYALRLFKLKHAEKYDNYIDGIEELSHHHNNLKEQLENVLLVIVKEMECIELHTQTLDTQKAIVSRTVREHVENCIEELGNINKLGKHKGQQLFQIQLPNRTEIEHSLQKIDALMDDIMNFGELEDVNAKINTFYLLNYTISLSSLAVKVLKYELNRGESKGDIIKWNEISGKTSGAQKFCIAFIVTVVLMEYKRYSQTYNSMDNSIKGKVLLMDNPFGETTEEQFLDELFDLADKFKVQIISYTHITNYSVRKHFDRIYKMTASKTPSNKELTRFTVIKGGSEEESVNLSPYRIKETVTHSTQASIFDM